MQEIREISERDLDVLRKEISSIEDTSEPPAAELDEGEDLTRYSFEELTLKAAIRGYLKGLEVADFQVDTLPEGFAVLLEDPDYEIPTWMWEELIGWDYDRQALAAYPIFEEVHRWRALRAVQLGTGPLGVLKGREHLALPLELAGKFHFEQMIKELHHLLVRFVLDKGATQDLADAGGVTYPRLVKLFLARRRGMCQKYRLDSYDAMARFVAGGSAKVGWPQALIRPFAGELESVLDAINLFAIHYF